METAGWKFRSTSQDGQQKLWRVAEIDLKKAEACLRNHLGSEMKIEPIDSFDHNYAQQYELYNHDIQEIIR